MRLKDLSQHVITKKIIKFVTRKFQGRSEKFCEVPDWALEVSVICFIVNQGFKVGEGHA